MAHVINDKIAVAEEIIGYQFDDNTLLLQALDRSRGDKKQIDAFAFLGDWLIGFILAVEGIQRNKDSSAMNNITERKGGNAFLAQQGYACGLHRCIFNNPSQRDFIFAKPMADTVEAIIGAVFLDSNKNLELVEEVMSRFGISWPEALI